MKKLILPVPMFSNMASLLEESTETCAVLFTYSNGQKNEHERLIAAKLEFPPDHAYRERTNVSAVLSPEYLVEVANYARANGHGLALAHTHAFENSVPTFSPIDDQGEDRTARFLEMRLSAATHVALVLGPGGLRCRVLGEGSPVEVIEIGEHVRTLFHADEMTNSETLFDRQTRAFGAGGQTAIRRLNVGIVGLGGTGSLIAQQLAYLGVRNFVLIDPDRVEEHNLNRLAGASLADVGSSKVMVAERHIHFINPDTTILRHQRDIVDDVVVQELFSTDFIFCCTDSHASRAVLNQLAYQHLIPCIDMGINIVVAEGTVRNITGRVQMLAPGLACLTCTNAIDARGVREELMTPEQRHLDPYFSGGAGEPQPAVISLNSSVTSLATTMFLGAVTTAPFSARYQIYDAVAGTVRAVMATADPQCVVCSSSGALARATSWPLPTRRTSR